MPRALITGAAGFIGGVLARRLLAAGWEVQVILRRGSRLDPAGVIAHEHDGTPEGMVAILETARPEVVFHLASLFLTEHQPGDIPALVGSNILFPLQLVEAMAVTGARNLVNTGTSWQHFGTDGYRPVNLYAATKQAFEDLLPYYHEARGLSCTTLKLFDTYGAADPRRKLVRILLEAARSGAPLDLSPGEQVLDLTHVEDVAQAFLDAGARLLAGPPVLDTFLVSGDRLTVRALADRIQTALGRPIQGRWGLRPYRPREVMLPQDPAGRLLPGWAPVRDLGEGLREAYEALPGQ
jgi:nucleoside-diphosphate-sugar epimerase